jgi:hypothetical protein
MAVTTKWYTRGLAAAFNKEVDWNSDTIKMALCTSTYTPNQNTHDYFNDITNEVTGTGYTAGGQTMTSCIVTPGTNVVTFDAADVVWTTSTLTARYAIVYDSTPGTSATNPLLCYIDFGADVSSTAASLTVAITDLLTISPA